MIPTPSARFAGTSPKYDIESLYDYQNLIIVFGGGRWGLETMKIVKEMP
jgi:hypothetical protein